MVADLEDGGSVTDEGDHGIGDATTERSTYPSEEVIHYKIGFLVLLQEQKNSNFNKKINQLFDYQDESGDCSDEPSVIEDVAVPPPHTTYLCDQQEVFGTVSHSYMQDSSAVV